jgi:hypothetical protein
MRIAGMLSPVWIRRRFALPVLISEAGRASLGPGQPRRLSLRGLLQGRVPHDGLEFKTRPSSDCGGAGVKSIIGIFCDGDAVVITSNLSHKHVVLVNNAEPAEASQVVA